MSQVSVTSKGQVTIPKQIRQKLGIQAGTQVSFRLVGDRAELQVHHPVGELPRSGFGMLSSQRESVPADFDVAALVSDH